MKHITSTEFRKRYAKLTEPTVVMVNDHPIGTWIPGFVGDDIQGYWHAEPTPAGSEKIREYVAATQAKRDDLLRKINRSR